MKNQHLSIRKIVSYLNNPIEQGGFWLPNIQRHFVWDEEQIEKLFDSIMREYPIGTLLIWKTSSKLKCRRFISNYKEDINILDTYETPNDSQKLLVLDGQQRLQSLFIATNGSYNKKEMYLDILHNGDENEDSKYKFKFLSEEKATKEWIKVKDIIYSNKSTTVLAREIVKTIENRGNVLSDEEIDRVNDTIAMVVNVFCTQEIIAYQELDSIDNPKAYSENDIVEVFIRSNSGGTALEKSDLLFALLTTNFGDIEEKLQDLMNDLNATGYNFNRDFILKTCLTLIGVGARYEVGKFRKNENILQIKTHWEEISDAIIDVKDFIYGQTYLKTDKALGAYTPLIPIIYLRYKYKSEYDKLVNNRLSKWLLKVVIAGVFSGSTDILVDACIKDIDDKKTLDFDSQNRVFINKNKTLDITRENILAAGYGTANARRKLYLLFNIWYEKFNFSPTFKDNEPNIDHIFPKSKLKTVKVVSEKSNRRSVLKYKVNDINQIANCMLLPRKENMMGNKGDKLPEEWFKDKSDKYLEMHMIPKDKTLWSLEKFDEFIEVRKELIVENLIELING